jgi:CRISPR-associated endonuclease/helicase Cas3
MARIFTGHHGKPPMQLERSSGEQIRTKSCFSKEDLSAAEAYAREVFRLFVTAPLPPVNDSHLETLKRHSWTLAGLAVLADWLGSDSKRFLYYEQARDLSEYWLTVAVPTARESIANAGLGEQQARVWAGAKAYLPDLADLTPLQQYAGDVTIGSGPQFFLLEDVTGAGKTEAALLLCHQLMSHGNASGFYFALPTMATANQMYRRVGRLYRGIFAEDAVPSLVLAHGARGLVEGFRESILYPMPTNDSDDLPLAGALCNAWIADSRKKALLADVGVETIDQALLGVLPVRHQSLRLLGLAGKVLVVDEVHAYDDYTSSLLTALVRAQAGQGGSVVLLSATVPASLRARWSRHFSRVLEAWVARRTEL